MNQIERIAVMTIIDNIEHQLRGLKTLLAASANQEHRSVSIPTMVSQDSPYASPDEEKILEKELEGLRQREVERLQKQAESLYANTWQEVAQEQ